MAGLMTGFFLDKRVFKNWTLFCCDIILIMKITSVNNDIVKETAKLLQRKYRDEIGMFLLEGEKCIEEALHSGIEIERLFVQEGYSRFNNMDIVETTDAVLNKISDTKSAPKCVAVAKQVKYNWDKNYKRVVLLENIKDAGNLGTIIRTSCAFNIDAIILYGDTVDLYNPKCVRATVGNLWKVPVFSISNFDELKRQTDDFTPIATLPKSKNTIWLDDFKAPEKTLIMFGTESDGLSEELKTYAKQFGQNLTIKMSDKVESLNLSISAGIIFYSLFQE